MSPLCLNATRNRLWDTLVLQLGRDLQGSPASHFEAETPEHAGLIQTTRDAPKSPSNWTSPFLTIKALLILPQTPEFLLLGPVTALGLSACPFLPPAIPSSEDGL